MRFASCGFVVVAAILSPTVATAQPAPERYDLVVLDASGAPVGAPLSILATDATCGVPDPGPGTPPIINPIMVRWAQVPVTGPGTICEYDATAYLAGLPLGDYTATLTASVTDGAGTVWSSPASDASNPFSSGPGAPSGLSLTR